MLEFIGAECGHRVSVQTWPLAPRSLESTQCKQRHGKSIMGLQGEKPSLCEGVLGAEDGVVRN